MSNFIAVIAEGGAETAIIDILLDADLLIFNRTEMIERSVLRTRKGKSFEQKHLNFNFGDNIIEVYRILDSKCEKFSVSKIYKERIVIKNIITKPAIEILIILANNHYGNYSKGTKLSPAEYVSKNKNLLGIKNGDNIKSYYFIKKYFTPEKLVEAIREYDMKCKIENVMNLCCLLK